MDFDTDEDRVERQRDKAREDLILSVAHPQKPGEPVLVDPPITNRTDGKRNGIDGLTPLQERFYHGILQGLGVADAAMQAGYEDHNHKAKGSELLAHPVIQARLRALRKLSEDDFASRRADLRAHVVSQLYHMSLHARDERHKLKALELLGKTNLVGLYSKEEQPERPQETDADALRAKLSEIVHRLADQAEPVEGPVIVRREPKRKAKALGALVAAGERTIKGRGAHAGVKRAYVPDGLATQGVMPAQRSEQKNPPHSITEAGEGERVEGDEISPPPTPD